MFLTLPSMLIAVKDFLKVGWAIDINTEIATSKITCILAIKMAYSNHQAERIRHHLNGVHFTEKKMMGGLIFMVRNAMCVGLDMDKKNNSDRLMVRVGKLDYEKLLHQKGSSPMDFTGKVMRGFLFIEAKGFDADEDLDFWISKALTFNQLLTSE